MHRGPLIHFRTDGHGKLVVARLLTATTIGIVFVAVRQWRRKTSSSSKPQTVVPRLELTGSGRVKSERVEKFSRYVARQLGFKDETKCPGLSKLASDFVRSSEGFNEGMYAYFSDEKEVESVCRMLVEELKGCVVAYFAFHWSQASVMIDQVLEFGSAGRTVKNMVLKATRKLRFERVTKDLKITRLFSSMVEEMRAIRTNDDNDASMEVMEPVAQCDRSPMLLFICGGIDADKSTVLKEILKGEFWSKAITNAVVVEADAFKERIYQVLSSNGHHNEMLEAAELVHQSSTYAALSLLVTALNEGRDVIVDGMLSWEPLVEQTIAMARNIHKHRYCMGVGYEISEDGKINENYWEKIENEEDEVKSRKPYRIDLVGVVCDTYLAVTRGIRRAIAVKREVRVSSLLKSHKRFINAFPKYCHLVDHAKLYRVGDGVAPKLIGRKDENSNLLLDPDQIKYLERLRNINDEADSIYELYADPEALTDADSIWNKFVLKPTRIDLQRDLRIAIERIEKAKL